MAYFLFSAMQPLDVFIHLDYEPIGKTQTLKDYEKTH